MSRKSKIIGLTGKARAGKDTVAEILNSHFALEAYSFADPLKKASEHLFGLTHREAFGLGGYDREEVDPFWGMSVREMQQKLGTECMRDVFCKDFWVKSLERLLESQGEREYVVSDVRFQNEADFVIAQGGVIIEIVRPGVGIGEEASAHVSEGGITSRSISTIITNSGSLDDLERAVVETVQVLFGE